MHKYEASALADGEVCIFAPSSFVGTLTVNIAKSL